MSRNLPERWKAPAIIGGCLVALIVGLALPVTKGFLDRHTQLLATRDRLNELEGRKLNLVSGNSGSDAHVSVKPAELGLLAADTNAEAFQRLDSYLRNALQSQNGDDIVIQLTAGIEEEGALVLRASVNARLPESDLLGIIHSLEAGSPAVFFDHVRLQPLKMTTSNTERDWVALISFIHVYLDLSPEAKK